MARKKKDGTPEAPAPEATKPEAPASRVGEFALTSGNTLKKLLNAKHRAKNDVAQVNGDYRQKLSEACADQNLHKGAYAILGKIDAVARKKKGGLEQAKLLWDTVLAYMDSSGLSEKLDEVQALPLDGEDAPAGDDAEGDAGDPPNVSRPKFGANDAAAAG